MAAIILETPILILIYIVPELNVLNPLMTWLPLSHGVTLYVFVIGILSILIQCILGYPHYIAAWHAIKLKTFNMDSLIVISTTASVLFGIALSIVGYSSVEFYSEMH